MVVVVPLLSHIRLFESPWIAACTLPCPSPAPRTCWNSCPLSQWCHPTISSSVAPFSSSPQFFPESVFSNESALHIRWPKYWNFSLSTSPSNEYSGLISFTIDWFNLLVVQRILKSLLQHHSLKASILWHSAFFIVHLSHPYMTIGKNHSFDCFDVCWQNDVSAFNTQSRLIDIPQLGITKPVKEFLSSARYQQRHPRLQS